MNTPVTLHASTHDYALASCGPLLVTRWHGRVYGPGLEHSFTVGRAIHREFPGEYCTFTITGIVSGLPDEPARKRAAAMMKELGPVTKLGVVLLDGEGFLAGAARATLTSIQQLSGLRSYVRFVRDQDEAIALLAQATRAITASEIRATVERTRADR